MRVPGVDVALLVHDAAPDKLTLVVSGALAPSAEAVFSALRATLEPFKLPQRIELVDDMPRTQNGKLDRAFWQRVFAETVHAAG